MVHYFGPPIDFRRPLKRKRADDTPDSPHDHHQFPEHDPLHDNDEGEGEHVNTPKDFPHAPLPVERDAIARHAVTKQQRNVKRQHFIVLNTILHKCLLDQDFVRAGKAFGLLLRLEIAGKRINLRHKALWGIGAEILLHQRPSSSLGDTSNLFGTHDDHVEEDSDNTALNSMFTAEGFQAAREYYERLILQYPYKKTRPRDTSSQHFYPAMFGLWIFEAQSRSHQRRRQNSQNSQTSNNSNQTSTPASSTDHQDASPEDFTLQKIQELSQARVIAARLDEVTFLPPFDQDAQLLKLKGMVALWVADLIAATSPGSQHEIDSQRQMAREHLRRAKARGWDGEGGLGSGEDEDEEEEEEVSSSV